MAVRRTCVRGLVCHVCFHLNQFIGEVMSNRRVFSLTAVLAVVALFCFAFSATAADASATGTWKWTNPGRGDNPQPRD